VWIEFIWLRIGKTGGLLWKQQQTFRFYKLQGIYWLPEKLQYSINMSTMAQKPLLSETEAHYISPSWQLTVPSSLYQYIYRRIICFFLTILNDQWRKWSGNWSRESRQDVKQQIKWLVLLILLPRTRRWTIDMRLQYQEYYDIQQALDPRGAGYRSLY